MPIVTCHSNKIICYKEDGSVEGFVCMRTKPSCGVDVGWPYQGHIQRILGNLLLRPPPPLSQPDSEQATALSEQLRSRFRLLCQWPSLWALWMLMISFAFPEKELREDFSVIGTSSGQQGCGWHGADWLVTSPPGASPNQSPNRWLQAEGVAERGDCVGGFRHRSGAVERTRTCWSSLRWPWHAVRGKPETHSLTCKIVAQIQATTRV